MSFAVGAALVSYRTDVASLALIGPVSRLGVGLGQGAISQHQAHAQFDRRDRRPVGRR